MKGKIPRRYCLHKFQVDFAGDNFKRYTGEVGDVAGLQIFAWESAQRGTEINIATNPTQADILYKQTSVKKSNVDNIKKSSLLEKYRGAAEHLDVLPQELLLGQTEHYVEFSQNGAVIKGAEKIIPRSKYPEDMYNFL